MCNGVFRPYVPKANMFTLWEGSPSRRNKLDFCEQKILYYYLFAALRMIVNKYVRQIALFTYLLREPKKITQFWSRERTNINAIFVVNKMLTFQVCVTFCAYSILYKVCLF